MRLRITLRRQPKRAHIVLLCLACVHIAVLSNEMARKAIERVLSLNLGGGNCKWQPPEPIDPWSPTYSTLIAAYPGSGKRLTYQIMEALTGGVAGDDWDLSLNGGHVIAMKTSYPHPEGIWDWGDQMDQAVLQIRNPRWAIPSYMSLRHELGYSGSWTSSFNRKDFVYTERPNTTEWEDWRDAKFDSEIDKWGWFIDFWMEGGQRRNDGDGNPYTDANCQTNMVDCKPKAVIAYEKLNDPATGPAEMVKLASVLEDHAEVPLIESEARACVYHETFNNNQPGFKLNKHRAGAASDTRSFTSAQLNIMRAEFERLRDKYSREDLGWASDPQAQTIVECMNDYIAEINAELTALLLSGA